MEKRIKNKCGHPNCREKCAIDWLAELVKEILDKRDREKEKCAMLME